MAIDKITNTVYFDDRGTVGTNPQNLATDIANLFATYRALPVGWDRVNVRLYDMAEPKPREIQGEFTNTTPTLGSTASGPREVALCLSFYAERNLPRNRGRIYIGPWNAGAMLERPTASLISSLNSLRTGLANIGGTDVQWCVYSPSGTLPGATPAFKQVSAGWVDDEWDTVRSRGLRAINRGPWTMEG